MRRSDYQHFRVSQLGGVRIGVPFGALRERSSLLALGLAQAGSHGHCRLGISLKISSAAILVIIGLYRFGGGHSVIITDNGSSFSCSYPMLMLILLYL